MFIFSAPRYCIDKALQYGVRIILAFMGIALLYILFFSWFYRGNQGQHLERISKNNGAGQKAAYAYEAIGTGGLMIRSHHAFGWISRLVDELALIAFNGRPDVNPHDAEILLRLKNASQEFVVQNGKTLYLEEMKEGKGLNLSQTERAFWIKPILMDNGTVLMEAGRVFPDQSGSEEKGQFFMTPQPATRSASSSEPSCVHALKNALYHPRDVLIQKYGGNEYASYKFKGTLELTSESASYACFVSVGDYLLFENGQWRMISLNEVPLRDIVAKVRQIQERFIELELWDETGFHPTVFRLNANTGASAQVKPELLPSKLRLRSETQVSCSLGKRRMILRQGDWLLKTHSGWKNLRRTEEIESFLFHRLKGELIIFDSIEKEQGKLFMKAHWFDETRTQSQPLSIPIEKENLPSKSSNRKPLPLHMRKAV